MKAESDVMVVAGVLALHLRIVPSDFCEGPSGTATSNYVTKGRVDEAEEVLRGLVR